MAVEKSSAIMILDPLPASFVLFLIFLETCRISSFPQCFENVLLCLIAELFLSLILPTGLSGNYIDSAIIPHILKTYFETFIDVPKSQKGTVRFPPTLPCFPP